jgi:uncharacterized protein (TIGR03437 family)
MFTRSSFTLAAIAFTIGCLSAQAQPPTVTGVVNNASNSAGAIAPGENIRINGSNLGDATSTPCRNPDTSLMTNCNGVTATLGGKAVAFFSESATSLSAEAPVDTPTGPQPLVVTRTVGGQPVASQAFTVTVNPTAPQMYFGTNNGINFGQCFNAPNAAINGSNPAFPGTNVTCQGTGFGATNPVVPTGALTPSPGVSFTAQVKVTVAGQNANVTSAGMSQGTIGGQAQITFTIPAGVPIGSQPIQVTAGTNNAPVVNLFIASNGPTVTTVVNSASNAIPGLPNAGVAPGSIIVAYGKGLGPDQLVTAPGYPWPSTLSGTSAKISVNGTTTDLLFYYSSATQIAGLLPSRTPPGNGTITVTYNGVPGPPSPISVVANNFGVYTVPQNGSGPSIVTFADYSIVSQTKAANPGETLIIWGTGLGAVQGDEASGPLPGDMTNLPVQVFIGGVAAQVVYRGRSGCCVGEDQIAVVVPNVSGCFVPVAVKINSQVSNFSTIGVAPSGRACKPASGLVPDAFTTLPTPKLVLLQTKRQIAPPPQSPTDQKSADTAQVSPVKLGITGAELNVALDGPPFGSCYVVPGNGGDNFQPPISGILDMGPSLTLKGPGGTRTIAKSGFQYSATLGDTSAGNFLDPGAYTFSGPGGADVSSFSTSFTIPAFTWTNKPANNGTLIVNRQQALTINWTGGDPNGFVQIEGNSGNNGAQANFVCSFPTAPGTATIPPNVLLAMPGGSQGVNGGISVHMQTGIQTFVATGADIGAIFHELIISNPAAFQ